MRMITGYGENGYDGIGEEGTRIPSAEAVGDLILVAGTELRDLPKLINHPWETTFAHGVYKEALASQKRYVLPCSEESNAYNIYECQPCDSWDYWIQIYMEDIAYSYGLFSVIWDAIRLFRAHTHWEGDVMSGPFISMVPSEDVDGRFILAIKQENNGGCFYCSRAELSDLKGELQYSGLLKDIELEHHAF